MKSNYKRLGDYISPVDVRNKDLAIDRLLGVSISKTFIESIANTVGTDFSNYKVVKRNQFAYGPVTSRNGDKISVALLNEDECIISSSYSVFKVNDEKQLLPDYLMLWFNRPEFDRYARYMSHGSVREIFSWDDMCDVELPVPSIEEQNEIVAAYEAIENRIALKKKINDNLEDTLNTIYKFQVTNNTDNFPTIPLGNICKQITDGKHGDCESQENSGYYFVSVKDIINGCICYKSVRQITAEDFFEAHKRTNLEIGDVLFTNSGTLGRMSIITSNDYPGRTTFQKSVAILKPDCRKISSTFLYLSLSCNKDRIIDFAHGSAQKNLLLSDIRSFEIKYPPEDYRKHLDALVAPLFKQIQHNHAEIVILQEIGSALLSQIAGSSH